MTANDDLSAETRGFAKRLQALLNGTICNNVVMQRLEVPDGIFLVGVGLDREELAARPFPVQVTHRKPSMFMNLSFKLQWDYSNEFLQVLSSYCGVSADADQRTRLFHADYERDKTGGYPEAHLHVHGQSSALAQLNRAGDELRGLEKLHFPVGGRRFRPCLEDIIEFLVVERLADAANGWQSVVNQSRDDFRRMQLRAAVRRDPETARAALEAVDTLTDA